MRSSLESRRRGAGIVAILIVLVAVVAAAVLAVSLTAGVRFNQTRHGWDRDFGSWDEIMARYPATEANAAAIELERLAAAVGVRLTPRSADERFHRDAEASESFSALKKEVLGKYSDPQLERALRGEIDAPPPALTSFMERYDAQLNALRRQLVDGESPIWESDAEQLWQAPIPYLTGQIYLHKLLANVALAQLHAGDPTAALETIEASYRLADSLRNSPQLICQLILAHATRLQLGTLRHVPDLPEEWIGRLEGHDYRESFLNARKFEGWIWLHGHEMFDSSDPRKWWGPLSNPVSRPYAKLCFADISDGMREQVVSLERAGAICDRELSALGAEFDLSVPRWNKLGGLVPGLLSDAVHRLARLELDLELTRLLAEADAQRRHRGDGWAESLRGERPAEACPDDRWIYTTDGEKLRIALSREPTWSDRRGAVLPTEATVDLAPP